MRIELHRRLRMGLDMTLDMKTGEASRIVAINNFTTAALSESMANCNSFQFFARHTSPRTDFDAYERTCGLVTTTPSEC